MESRGHSWEYNSLLNIFGDFINFYVLIVCGNVIDLPAHFVDRSLTTIYSSLHFQSLCFIHKHRQYGKVTRDIKTTLKPSLLDISIINLCEYCYLFCLCCKSRRR